MKHILLIGGSSSVGKTTLAAALGKHLRLETWSLDNLLRDKDDPGLTFFNGDPAFWDQSAQALCQRLVGVAECAAPYIRAFVTAGLQRGKTGIIEGEQVHPHLVEQLSRTPGIRGVFLIERDPKRLYQTLLERSQRFKDLSQAHRGRVVEMDWRYGLWLQSQAEARNLVWTNAQPWATLTERVLNKIR